MELFGQPTGFWAAIFKLRRKELQNYVQTQYCQIV